MSDFLQLLVPLIMIIVVLVLCYFFSRYISRKMSTVTNTSNIKVIERVLLGQDKYLAIALICNTYYLIGVTNQNIQILKELDEAEISKPPKPADYTFLNMLKAAMKGKKAGDGK
ncbi:MAG TPA: flagellar biosynthetic protein FliO [Clostridiales bacterium]|nr:flagellar biosynthetic protein FliO [Clostridiales bacterium]